MRRTAAAFAITASALLLAACGSSAKISKSPGSAPPPTAQPTASTASAAAPSQPAAAASLDPCQLVTSSEASSLAGASYGSGKEESVGKNGEKRCIYGSQTTNVFTVEVAQGQDAAAARAAWSQYQAQAQALVKQNLPAGWSISLSTKSIPGLADRAATAQGSTSLSGQTINFSGIYLLKGATFLAFQNVLLGKTAPSTADMEGEANRALARVP